VRPAASRAIIAGIHDEKLHHAELDRGRKAQRLLRLSRSFAEKAPMIRFSVSNGEQAGETIGPAPFFRLAGGSLLSGADGREIAHHLGFIWEYQGRLFRRIDSQDPLAVHFEGHYGAASETLGPFTHFWVVDGAAYGDGERLATLDEGQAHWCAMMTRERWPIMVLRPPD
jgi:hypothetical protein